MTETMAILQTGRIMAALVSALFAASGPAITTANRRPPDPPSQARNWNTWRLGQSGDTIAGPAWVTWCSDMRHLRLKSMASPKGDADPVSIEGGDPLGKILFVPTGYRLQMDETDTPRVLCSGYLP